MTAEGGEIPRLHTNSPCELIPVHIEWRDSVLPTQYHRDLELARETSLQPYLLLMDEYVGRLVRNVSGSAEPVLQPETEEERRERLIDRPASELTMDYVSHIDAVLDEDDRSWEYRDAARWTPEIAEDDEAEGCGHDQSAGLCACWQDIGYVTDETGLWQNTRRDLLGPLASFALGRGGRIIQLSNAHDVPRQTIAEMMRAAERPVAQAISYHAAVYASIWDEIGQAIWGAWPQRVMSGISYSPEPLRDHVSPVVTDGIRRPPRSQLEQLVENIGAEIRTPYTDYLAVPPAFIQEAHRGNRAAVGTVCSSEGDPAGLAHPRRLAATPGRGMADPVDLARRLAGRDQWRSSGRGRDGRRVRGLRGGVPGGGEGAPAGQPARRRRAVDGRGRHRACS